MYISLPAVYTHTIHDTKLCVDNGYEANLAIEESSSTYIRRLSKINANILGI